MPNIDRRNFVKLTGGILAASTLVGFPHLVKGIGKKKVVVVGGGTGGATAARCIHMADPSIEVTLIERNPDHYTCYFSNEVLSGERDIESNHVTYEGLRKEGINLVHDTVTSIESANKKVHTMGGKIFDYDRVVVAPGVDFRWERIEGYSEEVSHKIPHAWKAGPQTVALRKQLQAMPDSGTVIIVAPPNPFRCPPGPYERASQIALYLKRHKPKSKILILDSKDKFSKQLLFEQAWERLYGYKSDNSMIEWIPAVAGGSVSAVDPRTMTVTALVENYKGDVINIIPPQKAGKIAFDADLVDDSGWVPVDTRTFESTKHPGIHVIGDASIATRMPKSGYAANSQAKVAAAAIVDLLNGRDPGTAAFVNTCFSIAGEDYGFSVAGVYRASKDGKSILPVKGAGGLTPMDASPEALKREVAFGHGWFKNILHDSFGTS